MALLLPGCALIRQGTSQAVTFTTNPPKAEIWVNGKKHKDLTPATLVLPKEEQSIVFVLKGFENEAYRLKCRTSGYFYWSLLMGVLTAGVDWVSGAWKEFEIPDNGTVLVELRPDKENPEQFVYFSSNPSGAAIKIDGLDQQGTTGIKGRGTRIRVKWGLQEREKKVILRLKDFEDAELALKKGDTTLHWNLEPAPERITYRFESEPEGADVYVDGKRRTKTPDKMQLEWFPHTKEFKIEFRHDGYEPWITTLRHKTEQTLKAPMREKVDVRPVMIDCAPAGTTIEEDGKVLGVTPAVINFEWSVNIKRHTLTFSRPGYESKVVLLEDWTKPVEVRLSPSLPRLP